MIRIDNPSMCCGCTACQAVCPHEAISMKGDRLGFLYPQVDMDRCTDCGLCESVCSFSFDVEVRRSLPEDVVMQAYAARHVNPDVVMASQSGGVFTAVSDKILEDGGVVYGAAFDSSHDVKHLRAETREERDRMRGSKYVQSDMGTIFRMVRKDLKDGRKVLFSGTPCQVAGLRSYIPEYLQDNLLLVDFVCHGVPSPSVWKDYVKYMERQGKVVKADFRDKQAAGWKVHKESFLYEDGRKVTGETFRVLFYKNIMLRHSCAVCPYDVSGHKSDLTLGDFWGIEEVLPSMDSDAGTSMLICSSAKGRRLLETASDSLDMTPVSLTYDFMARRNPNLVRPARIYKDRMKFEEEYYSNGFLSVARRWGDMGLRYRLWKMKVHLKKLFSAR